LLVTIRGLFGLSSPRMTSLLPLVTRYDLVPRPDFDFRLYSQFTTPLLRPTSARYKVVSINSTCWPFISSKKLLSQLSPDTQCLACRRLYYCFITVLDDGNGLPCCAHCYALPVSCSLLSVFYLELLARNSCNTCCSYIYTLLRLLLISEEPATNTFIQMLPLGNRHPHVFIMY
jgi:hypothetical protein